MSTESDYIKVLKIKGANGEEKILQFPMKLDLERPKRPRTMFSEQQLTQLEEAFRTSGYLTGPSRAQLALRLGLSDTQVKVWFQNRRTKDRRKVPCEQNTVSKEVSPAQESIAPIQYPLMYPTHQMISNNMFYPFPHCAQY